MYDPNQQDIQNAFGQYYVPPAAAPAPNPGLAGGPSQAAVQKAFGQYYVPPQGALAGSPPAAAGPSQAAVADAFGQYYRPPSPMASAPPPVAPQTGPTPSMADYYKVQAPMSQPASANQQIKANVASLKQSLSGQPNANALAHGAPQAPPPAAMSAPPAAPMPGASPSQFDNPAFQPPPPGLTQNQVDEMGGQGDDSYQKFDAGGT
jgi:hypothetical protein